MSHGVGPVVPFRSTEILFTHRKTVLVVAPKPAIKPHVDATTVEHEVIDPNRAVVDDDRGARNLMRKGVELGDLSDLRVRGLALAQLARQTGSPSSSIGGQHERDEIPKLVIAETIGGASVTSISGHSRSPRQIRVKIHRASCSTRLDTGLLRKLARKT